MRKHESMAQMISVEEALRTLLHELPVVSEVESVPIGAARGRVLAEDCTSSIDVPSSDNSQMDGYAVSASDLTKAPLRMPVSQRIPAGTVGTPLTPHTAARIFTGAPIPVGADCVVMQEECEASGDGASVGFLASARPGQWVRRQGEDITKGSIVVRQGTRLGPAHLGLIASVGLAQIKVYRPLRLALLSTGDELALPGEPLKPGAIYNSNRYTLKTLAEDAGCAVTDLGIVADTLEATRAAFRQASGHHDVLLTTGGVSVGEEDHVKAAVQSEGTLDLWQIAVKPGKPLAFGRVDKAVFLGLPGNPVSSFVTFLLFVLPVIRAMQGEKTTALAWQSREAAFDWPRPDKRQEYLRVRVGDDGRLALFENQGSAVLTSLAWASGLVENPPGQVIRQGDTVRYLPFSEFRC